MDYVRLILGLIVPWMCGFFWLRAIESKVTASLAPNIFRQLGYGLFLGYATLHGLIMTSAALFQQIHFWPLAGTISLITIIGAMLVCHSHRRTSHHTQVASGIVSISPARRALLMLLIAWIVIHLSLAAVEILYRPVFPWDAWLSWMYRAKAWFQEGSIFQFNSPTEWASDMTGLAYNVPGHNYPTFVSTIALWAASSLGYWSDTLVNVPVLFCGMALAMAIYGQCSELGGNRLESVVSAYLLVSVPLLGAHLSLAGMADIWMAGFTGLGFVALIRGLIHNDRFQRTLGLLMAALAIGIKVEGIVWFLAALSTYLLVIRPRLSLGIAGIFLLLVSIAWLTGLTYLELPGLGGVGYANGLAHIPFKGSYPLMQFDVADDYFINFFSRGSWNLLWSLILLSLPLLISKKTRKIRPALISFYLVFATTQIVIFGFSEQGRWAEDSSAINRLPLHFLPALIFCLMLTVISQGLRNSARTDKYPTINSARRMLSKLLPPVLAITITAAGLVAYLSFNLPNSQGTPRQFKAEDMRFVVGNGEVENGIGFVNRYANNIAVVSSGSIIVAADALPLLEVETAGENGIPAGFFWRRRGDSENVESISLPGKGKHFIDLSFTPGWKGKITEVGLVFYRDENRSIEFHQLALLPQTIGSSLHTLWGQWTQYEPWTQASLNWIAGGSRTQSIPLPLATLAWLLVLIIMYWLFAGRSTLNLSLILAGCLLFWMLLDIRWTTNRAVQAVATISSAPPAGSPAYIDFSGDQKIAELIHSAKAVMPEQAVKVLIFSADEKMRFQMLRAKYHLLPHAAYVHEGSISSIPEKPVNYVLMIKPVFLDPVDTMPNALEIALILQQRLGQKYELITDNEIGMLFQASTSER